MIYNSLFSPATSKKSLKTVDSSANLSSQDLTVVEPPEPVVNRGSKVLSFFRGADAQREKSPNRNTNNQFDVSAVKYTPKLDRDSVDETGMLVSL